MRLFTYKYSFLIVIACIFIESTALASGGDTGSSGNTGGSGSSIPIYGEWVCQIMEKLTFWLPETPSEYYFSNLANQIIGDIPFIGKGIIVETLNILKNVLILVVGWKIFKSLPGRF